MPRVVVLIGSSRAMRRSVQPYAHITGSRNRAVASQTGSLIPPAVIAWRYVRSTRVAAAN